MNRLILSGFTASLGLAALGGCAASPHHTGSSAVQPATASPSTSHAQGRAKPVTGPGGLRVSSTVSGNQPFTVKLVYAQGYGQALWRISLRSVTCGAASFKPSIIRQDEASMGEPYAMPSPSASMKFCLVRFNAANLSTSNQNWQASQEATLNAGQDAYSSYTNNNDTQSDPMQAYQNWANQHGVTDTAFGANPGISGVDYAVYEIPARAQPTSVSVLASAYASGPVVLIVLPGG
jgi:hypothetical protein